jgi:hypothetical protein
MKIWKHKLGQKLKTFVEGIEDRRKKEKYIAIEDSKSSSFHFDTEENGNNLSNDIIEEKKIEPKKSIRYQSSESSISSYSEDSI